jgi:NAD(P)-dependent dehydrogenase (short-subunit alcohol dehydrogenase family)
MSERLKDEIAIITGSTHGIGRSVAIMFAEQGASVVVSGRDTRAGAEVIERIREVGGRGAFVRADLLDPEAGVTIVSETLQSFGRPTILINNAGSTDLVRDGTDRAMSEIDDASWSRVLEVNLTGPMRVTRAALREMIPAGRGAIVNISSLAARVGVPGVDAYTAAKGAIEALTRSLAVEYSPYGIRCNCIQVHLVQVVDERKGRAFLDPGVDERVKRTILTRGGRPSDVAGAALFLASREAGFVTGIVLPLDGGASAVSGMPWATPRPSNADESAGQERSWSSTT